MKKMSRGFGIKVLCFVLLCAGCVAPNGAPVPSPSPTPISSSGPVPLTSVTPVTINAKAVLPYTELEAEDGSLSGGAVVQGPGTDYLTPESESSGRKYIKLGASGDSVEWVTAQAANSIVVRYSIPDSTTGGSASFESADLDLYVDGVFKQSLTLTSKYAWVYGTPQWGTSEVWSQSPTQGSGHKFFDEVSCLLSQTIPPGSSVKLQKHDSATDYISVDLIDLENVAAAGVQPGASVLFSADNTGATDVTSALQSLIDVNHGGVIFVPAGTYKIASVNVSNVTIRGAGMWHTRFTGPDSRFQCTGSNCKFYDFAVFGETGSRNDVDSGASNAFNGNPGSGSVLQRIWVEHKKCAFWVGDWNNATAPDNLRILNCRFRNLTADAVNFCSGTSDSLVDNTQIRYSGDDALASWSPRTGGPLNSGNTFSNNTIQLPWIANGIALYGGTDMTIAGNVISDSVVSSSGVFIADRYFDSRPFGGGIRVSGNTLLRCGSDASSLDSLAGALRIVSADKPITAAAILIDGNDISYSVNAGVSLHGSQELSGLDFFDNTIDHSGSAGIRVLSNATGWATFEKITISGSAAGAFVNSSGTNFKVIKGTQNTGW